MKVVGYIDAGVREGAKLVCGGKCMTGKRMTKGGKAFDFDAGNFVLPTIFSDCSDSMSIVREEIFGPVMCVLPFRDEDEVNYAFSVSLCCSLSIKRFTPLFLIYSGKR